MLSKRKNSGRKYDSFKALLQAASLRPTRQRLALAEWLFAASNRHVSAEQVHAAAKKRRLRVSLATIYNTLNGFVRAGLLRQMTIDGGQVIYDTNTKHHHHLYDEKNSRLQDIPASSVRFGRLPKVPAHKSLSSVDVVLRVR